MTPAQYSRQATTDLETAISTALATWLEAQSYPPVGGARGQGTLTFLRVYEDWPSFMDDSALVPSAAVLPTGPIMYGPSHPTPTLDEDTWEPAGQPGLGLFVLSEASREFEVTFRGQTQAERNALKLGLETTFQDPRVIGAQVMVPDANGFVGARYGILLPMPEYWGLTCRLTLLSSEKLDDSDQAAKNIHEGKLTLRAEARHVKLGPVVPFTLKLVDLSP